MRYLCYILILLLFSQIALSQKVELQPPKIKAVPVTENYFGIEIIDEFRNLEDTKDSTVLQWYKDENGYAENILNSINGVDALAKKMKEINNRQEFYVKMINVLENGMHFYLKKDKVDNTYKLFYRKQFNDPEELLYTPKDFKPETNENYTINYIKPSWEGDYVVVSLSHSGKEVSELVIVDVNKKTVLPEVIDKAWPSSFLGISWLPDSSGIMFLQFPIVDTENKEFKKNTQSVLYKIGDDADNIKVILSSTLFPTLGIKSNEYPIVTLGSRNDPYIVAYIATVENFWDAYFLPIDELGDPTFSWKPFYSKSDMVYTDTGMFNKNDYIYKSALNAPNLNICSVSLDDINFEFPTVLVPEKDDEVLDEFKITSNGIFYSTSKNGVEAKFYHLANGRSEKITLPKKTGKISLASKGINLPELWLNLSGWITSNERCLYLFEENRFKSEELAPKAKYIEFENFVVDEISVASHDGTLVPLSIIYNSSLKRDGNNPSLFYGYGAYGDAINPFFSPLFLTWVENGGVLCIPHVRGGGEKGEIWHKGGYKATKPNTWKDLIACVEYMIDTKYTSPENTVVYGNSAGGIMVGGATTERPELFKAAIVDVGVLNPLRREAFSGSSNYKEYGTVKDSVEFKGLLAMDPYMRLEKDTEYPAGLYMTGMNDPRLPPWMTGKFVAKLRTHSSATNPILYKVKQDAGHGKSATSVDLYLKWAQMFAFGLWQTGHNNYQLELK